MSQITIKSIEDQIALKKKETNDLEVQLKEAKLQSPDKQLAEELHGMLCRWNHEDGCGWFYEFDKRQPVWTSYAHGKYLMKAQKLIGMCKEHMLTVESAIDMFKTVRDL